MQVLSKLVVAAAAPTAGALLFAGAPEDALWRRRVMSSLAACVAFVLGSCSAGEDAAVERQFAGALVEGRNGSALAGTVTIKRRGDMVRLFLNVLNAPPGAHGVHLHASGDCEALVDSPSSAHWNPENHPHGAPADAAHLGDLGNLHVDDAGRGLLTFSSGAFGLGDGSEFDILGRALVIRERADDLATQPSGNAGPPIACAQIR